MKWFKLPSSFSVTVGVFQGLRYLDHVFHLRQPSPCQNSPIDVGVGGRGGSVHDGAGKNANKR
jgi:hypothetical protein